MLPSDPKGSRFSYTTWIRCGTGDSTHLRWVHPIDNPPSIINSLICTLGKRNDVGTGPGWRGIVRDITYSLLKFNIIEKRTWSTCKNGCLEDDPFILGFGDLVRFQGQAVILSFVWGWGDFGSTWGILAEPLAAEKRVAWFMIFLLSKSEVLESDIF